MTYENISYKDSPYRKSGPAICRHCRKFLETTSKRAWAAHVKHKPSLKKFCDKKCADAYEKLVKEGAAARVAAYQAKKASQCNT